MTAAGLWGRVVLSSLLSFALLFSLSPPRPAAAMGPMLAALLGISAGTLLFAAGLRCAPHRFVSLYMQAALLLWAANEEILWRRVVLGELLPLGTPLALAVSSTAFALAHRSGRLFHVVTGLVFGGAYLATGSLVACVLAHWVYNVLVGSVVEGARIPP